jgi:hypothetical protein
MRLPGERKAFDHLTPTLDHIVIDRSEQFRDDAKAIKKLGESVPVIVAVNNRFAGYSPQTIRDLMEAFGSA